MRQKTEYTPNRDVNNGRTKISDLPGIHNTIINESCRKKIKENQLQSQVQQTEQNAITGYFRSRIAKNPATGDAV